MLRLVEELGKSDIAERAWKGVACVWTSLPRAKHFWKHVVSSKAYALDRDPGLEWRCLVTSQRVGRTLRLVASKELLSPSPRESQVPLFLRSQSLAQKFLFFSSFQRKDSGIVFGEVCVQKEAERMHSLLGSQLIFMVRLPQARKRQGAWGTGQWGQSIARTHGSEQGWRVWALASRSCVRFLAPPLTSCC